MKIVVWKYEANTRCNFNLLKEASSKIVYNEYIGDLIEVKCFFQVRMNRDIFFFVSNGARTLTLREACTVESAARLHPSRQKNSRCLSLFLCFFLSTIFHNFNLG